MTENKLELQDLNLALKIDQLKHNLNKVSDVIKDFELVGYKEVKDSNIVFSKLVKLGFIKKIGKGYQASPDTLAG